MKKNRVIALAAIGIFAYFLLKKKGIKEASQEEVDALIDATISGKINGFYMTNDETFYRLMKKQLDRNMIKHFEIVYVTLESDKKRGQLYFSANEVKDANIVIFTGEGFDGGVVSRGFTTNYSIADYEDIVKKGIRNLKTTGQGWLN